MKNDPNIPDPQTIQSFFPNKLFYVALVISKELRDTVYSIFQPEVEFIVRPFGLIEEFLACFVSVVFIICCESLYCIIGGTE